MKAVDLTGQKFGRWTVLGRSSLHHRWDCVCDCGTRRDVWHTPLTTAQNPSCGCRQREEKAQQARLSGTKTREYAIWKGMKKRCYNKSDATYLDYGAKGIRVCARWMTFENFIQDMGPSNGLTLERKDSKGNYTPENCMWATPTQQARNRSTTVLNEVVVSHIKRDLLTGMRPPQVSEKYGVKLTSVYDIRLGRSWRDVKEAA
ncbi:HNH endonuclease [Achromobacter phage 2-1]|nr:HNH endonuclease [Achromobacter phage 2-1]